MHLWAKLTLLIVFGSSGCLAHAAEHLDRSACDLAAKHAAQKTGTPLSVLQAVARVESGRNIHGEFGPWPWTANVDGKSFYYSDRETAVRDIETRYSQGAESIDIGCFQLNTRWHGQAFSSVEQMFEPSANADYAAKFLQDLFQKTGSWEEAIGTYHSKNPTYSAKYVTRVAAMMQTNDASIPEQPKQTAENSYPLLRSGKGNGNGSLVPMMPSKTLPLLR